MYIFTFHIQNICNVKKLGNLQQKQEEEQVPGDSGGSSMGITGWKRCPGWEPRVNRLTSLGPVVKPYYN